MVILAARRACGATDEQLVERCGADPIPSTAQGLLRNTVSRLRKLVGDGFIVRTKIGYALGPDVGVDLDRLEDYAPGAVRRRPPATVPAPVASSTPPSAWREASRWPTLPMTRGGPRRAVLDRADRRLLGDRWIELAADDADISAVPRARELAVARPDRETWGSAPPGC